MCYENFINNNIVNTPYFRYPNINDKLILEKYFNNINNLSMTKYINKINHIDKKISSFYITKYFDNINILNLLEYYNPIIKGMEFKKNENTIIEEFENDIIENSTIEEFNNTIIKDFKLEKDIITKSDIIKEYDNIIENSDTENYNIIISKNTLSHNDIQKNNYDLLPIYANIFYNLSKFDVIEDCFYSDSEKFILEIMKYDINFALRILAKTYTMYCHKESVLISILHIMHGFESDIIDKDPFIKTLAISCLTNKSDLVKDQALKFFDNCGSKDDIRILENIEPFNKSWLEDYRKEIIDDLRNR